MSTTGKARMRVIHSETERLLNQIALLFPATYKLTLVARNTSDDDAHVILTVDDMPTVISVIEKLYADSNVHESPGVN